MKKLMIVLGSLMALGGVVHAANTPQQVFEIPSITLSSTTVAAGTATVTISSPTGAGAFSTGVFTYINHVHIEEYAASTLTGGATPVTCTTTNLNSKAYKFPTALAVGAVAVIDQDYSNPIVSQSSGTITTISCPGQPNTIWNVSVEYFYKN